MKSFHRVFVISFLLAIGVIMIRAAWVGDDTYITMRVVDNVVHGYGLRWNIDERVQVFTHPFWMLLLLAGYLIVRDAFVAIMFVSVSAAIASAALFLFKIPKTIPVLFTSGIALGLSKSFMDFSVSGMENPLTHILLLGFLILLFAKDDFAERDIFLLSLCAGLAAFNRMDSVLMFLPALVYLFTLRRSARIVGLVAIGFAPFLLWELFSIVYYGFPLPNTFYAKLNTGIPTSAMIGQGFLYFRDSLSRDPITLTVIALALLLAAWKGRARERVIALGMVFYLGYILYVGGDFMSGRFFSAPYLMGVFLFARALPDFNVKFAWGAAVAFLMMGCLASIPTFAAPTIEDMEQSIRDFESPVSVLDVRARAYPYSSLAAWMKNTKEIFPDEKVARRAARMREDGQRVSVEGTVGLVGFFGGPQLHIIDGYALGDVLLARLPVENPEKWKIAHFLRPVPAGYVETFETGKNQIEDPNLALYYDKMRIIVSGDLWTRERWQAIWQMNMGMYDDLLAKYAAR